MIYPDAKGRYGAFGGRYVPETLVPALDRLQAGIAQHLHSADFQREFTHELKTWVGRPTALSFAPALSVGRVGNCYRPPGGGCAPR